MKTMIPYDDEAKAKYPDLTGWWVRHYVRHDCDLVVDSLIRGFMGHICFIEDDETYVGIEDLITHLLGIDQPKRLHPQQVADLYKETITIVPGTNQWIIRGEQPKPGDRLVISQCLVEFYDPDKHQTEYHPRPIYRQESEQS